MVRWVWQATAKSYGEVGITGYCPDFHSVKCWKLHILKYERNNPFRIILRIKNNYFFITIVCLIMVKERQSVLPDAGTICKHCLSYRCAIRWSSCEALSGGSLLLFLQNHRWLLNLWDNRCLCATLWQGSQSDVIFKPTTLHFFEACSLTVCAIYSYTLVFVTREVKCSARVTWAVKRWSRAKQCSHANYTKLSAFFSAIFFRYVVSNNGQHE
jgi:hypothetical protein